MCGIAGEFNWKFPTNPLAVEALISGILHRGPDDRGLWSPAHRACVLGHARLSILDLSPAGHQPMLDVLTGNAIVFNGEIYNFQSLRKECEVEGDTFRSHTDTEVILALYRRHGVACLRLLRGMFALAIWDERLQCLFLARDRAGKKPLNYALTQGGLAFCSEISPLSYFPGVDTQIDDEALELYLQCQSIPAPWTIHKGIRKLPPAHYAMCGRDGLTIKSYWELDYRTKVLMSEEAALDSLDEKLTEAVRLRMVADVPLGVLLSGGVDSSLIVALMSKISKEPVRTFSIGFDETAFNELPWAGQVAERYRTEHHPEIIKGNIHGLLPLLIRHYGEPFADHSAVASFLVSRSARSHVTIALNGDGGDELLGGYSRYSIPDSNIRASTLLGRCLPPQWLADLSPHLLFARNVPLRVLRRLLLRYTNPELQSILMFQPLWNDVDRRRLFPDGPQLVLRDYRRWTLAGAFAHADNPIDRMLWIDNNTYLPSCLLPKMDIASMHCGLETRSPLLDQVVVEFCAQLPCHFKVRNRTGKYLLKRLAERYFPVDFVHRPKMGFGIPVADWMRGVLRSLVENILGDAGLMHPLDHAVVQQCLRDFFNGKDANTMMIWTLFLFGLWQESRRTGIR